MKTYAITFPDGTAELLDELVEIDGDTPSGTLCHAFEQYLGAMERSYRPVMRKYPKCFAFGQRVNKQEREGTL